MTLRFRQVDVFTPVPLLGNPVAVVLDADGLADASLQNFARWTNLSETTFVLAPTVAEADYRVRIFTPSRELPFAGHPTLGTCHAWLEAGGRPKDDAEIVQECGAGLIRISRGTERLAFAAPPLIRSGEVEQELIDRIADILGIAPEAILDSQWVDNGPGWVAVLLEDADAVLSVQPRQPVDMDLGVVGLYPPDHELAIEVRAFDLNVEDPVTGSLNASVAGWLLASGRVEAPYVAGQGTAIGRRGRVHISTDADRTIWVGGQTITCVEGEVRL
jgi:PhzF family phenazine biosynthesis protein